MISGPTGSPESIRALLRSDPSVIEQGFRLFDFDFKTGPSAMIDAIGADRSGRLTIVAVSNGDPEAALTRLLDAHVWVADQRDLLGRMYSDRGVKDDRPARGFLLAPSFTHAFLRRLSLMSVEVTPCLARDVQDGNGARLTIIEPAAPIFGLEAVEKRASTEPERDDRQPFWPEGVLPSAEPAPYGNRSVATEAPSSDAVSQTDEPVPLEEMPWPDAPEERFPWELDAEAPGGLPVEAEVVEDAQESIRRPAATPLPDEPAPPGTFEALTVEELDEFERFERQRRERGRRTS
jgi:hypothetical protein